MKAKLMLAISLIFSGAVHAEETVIDIPALVGKNKAEVSKLIGAPTSCGASKYGEKCQYKKADTEIVFISSKADWITIEGIDDKPYSDKTIELFGFKPKKPTFSNAFTMRWEPLQDLLSVSLFKGTNNSDYIYVKAYTK